MEKIKTYIKYITHILAALGAILVGLSGIWDIPHATEIGQAIAVIVGVIGTCWITDTTYKYYKGSGD